MTRVTKDARGRRAIIAGVILTAALIATLAASAAIGQFSTSVGDVAHSLTRAVAGWFGAGTPVDPAQQRIDAALWAIRFPRAALGAVIGATLAVAGAMMQGVFANPLAEPSIIGVNSGASVGAAIVFVFGLALTAPWVLPVVAFVGALVVALLVWIFARAGGTAAVLTVILTGIAINAVAAAATSFLIFLGSTSSREQIIFWQLGSLAGATWRDAAIAAIVFAVGFVACLMLRRQIDVLSLGDSAASSTGVGVEKLRMIVILLVSVLTGVAVAFGGVIAFVGLIVPHALRLTVGPSHRYLIPLSALGGAVLLSLADIAARTVIPYADLPIGVFTAVVGGPLFLVMLRSTLRGYRMAQ